MGKVHAVRDVVMDGEAIAFRWARLVVDDDAPALFKLEFQGTRPQTLGRAFQLEVITRDGRTFRAEGGPLNGDLLLHSVGNGLGVPGWIEG